MPEPDFYIDEFVKELKQDHDVEGFTTRELAKREGVSIRRASDIMKQEIERGFLERVGRRSIPKSDGSKGWVAVYRTKKRDTK